MLCGGNGECVKHTKWKMHELLAVNFDGSIDYGQILGKIKG